jgi:hypothetical protein
MQEPHFRTDRQLSIWPTGGSSFERSLWVTAILVEKHEDCKFNNFNMLQPRNTSAKNAATRHPAPDTVGLQFFQRRY